LMSRKAIVRRKILEGLKIKTCKGYTDCTEFISIQLVSTSTDTTG